MVLGSAGQDVAEFLRTHYPEEALGILTHTADGGLTSLRANPLKGTPEALCEKLLESGVKSAQPGLVPGSVLAKFEGSPAEHPLFKEGCFHVEGQASQLAALCVEAKPGDTVLDLCAAPGGKTAHLLELADCSVTALESDPQRAPRINENLSRLALKADVGVCDAADIARWWDGKPFDAVLLDAPCTASGIVRRHPEIVFSRRPDDIVALAQQQKRLLEALWPVVKSGGRLLYAVCSVFAEEGSQQITAFLETHADAQAVALPKCSCAQLRLMPCDNPDMPELINGPHDGFFYSLLQKR